jgi:hypothetical protein
MKKFSVAQIYRMNGNVESDYAYFREFALEYKDRIRRCSLQIADILDFGDFDLSTMDEAKLCLAKARFCVDILENAKSYFHAKRSVADIFDDALNSSKQDISNAMAGYARLEYYFRPQEYV